MMGIELSEIDTVFRNHWLWSTRRPSVAWLRRSDHPGDVSRPLEAEIRDRVEAQTGVRPTGEILLVTHLRYFGYVMNPVSFYLIRDERDRLETVVADVTNTPWGERHLYVLPTSNPDDDVHEFRFAKALPASRVSSSS